MNMPLEPREKKKNSFSTNGTKDQLTGVQQMTNAPMMIVIVRRAFRALLVFCRWIVFDFDRVDMDVFTELVAERIRFSSNLFNDPAVTCVIESKLAILGTMLATDVNSPLVSFDDERLRTSSPLDNRLCSTNELPASSSMLICGRDRDEMLAC